MTSQTRDRGGGGGALALSSEMSSVSASGVVLPEGWAACIDPTHNVEYYFDLVNNCAQWEFPQAPATRAGGAVPAPTSDAGQHEAAAAGHAPTAAEAAGAQAALGALLDADGQEELQQAAAAAAPYAKAFPAVAEALAAMERAVTLKPDMPEAHYNLGIGLDRAGRSPEAVAAFQTALKLKPSLPKPMALTIWETAQAQAQQREGGGGDAEQLCDADLAAAHQLTETFHIA